MMSWKFDQGLDQSGQKSIDAHDELLPGGLDDPECQTGKVLEDDYVGRSSTPATGRFLKQPALKRQSRGESWMNELHSCASKLVDPTNERVSNDSCIKNCFAVTAPDDGERECFICLPPEPRRRWLQRMLHRRYPLRYNCNF